jgi:hypothetical protein
VSQERRLLRLLMFQPQLAARCPKDWPDDGRPETRTFLALLESIRHSANLVTRVAILEAFRDNAYGSLLNEVSREIEELGWDESFDVEAEFAGVLEQRSKELTDGEFAALLKKKLSDLSPEEKQLMQQYRQQGK